MRLIIDGNSYLNSALLRGTDHDAGYKVLTPEGKEVQVNGHQYGVDNFWDKVVEDLKHFDLAPRQVLLGWDGPNAKARRRAYLPNYKAGRDKIEEVNVELNKARDRVSRMMLDLGGTVIQQKGMEADDVIGYLCQVLRGERNVVGTSDGDLSVLVDENTDVWRLGQMNANPYGPFPHRFITLYKALVGDSGDKIPGAAKFGDGKFVDLVRIFGMDGLELMEQLILEGKLDRLREDLSDFPALKLIIDSKDQVALSWRCASLHIEDVNTMRNPLEIQAGMVKGWADLPGDGRVDALREFYGTKTLVHAGNYQDVRKRLAARTAETPFFALDIETSASDESEEWVEALMKATDTDRERIDVLGHELTGMSITFGKNTQHTIYMTVDHVEAEGLQNISVDQCREMVEVIPQEKHTVIQNRQFELSVLYRTWGEKWMDNGWHGFVPNAIDTKIGASYTDENLPKGLKDRSRIHLGYEQATYEETTTKHGRVGTTSGGRVKRIYDKELEPAVMAPHPKSTPEKPRKDVVVTPAVTEQWEERQYRMNELTAKEVVDYGCDDTICTAALHSYYKLVMDIEHTWGVYLEVEQLPEYMTTLAFVQGVKVSLAKLREMEKRDDELYEKSWATLRAYLLKKGWEGTICPEFEGELEPSDVKLAASIILPQQEFVTKRRKLNAIAEDLRTQFPDNDIAFLLAGFTEEGDIEGINKLVRQHFTGEPSINFGSPKQMQNLLFDVIGVTPRVFNPLTPKQKEDVEMAAAFRRLRQFKTGKITFADFTPREREIVISKASTDDDVVAFSLAKDQFDSETIGVLQAFQSIKKVMTRRSLFYKTYRVITHWRDGRIHSSMNQCEAVTRRYSSSGPNVQQLDDFIREIFLPPKDHVVASLDESSQELRHFAHWSQDENLKSCYIGENLRDMHSMTAVSAAVHLWGKSVEYDEFRRMLKSENPDVAKRAYELRQAGKTTNFGDAFGLQAEGLSIKLMVDSQTAQQFLDAKAAAFPRVNAWKAEAEANAVELGYSTTLLGARRHLGRALMSENSWDRSRAERQAVNFHIQSGSAEQIKLNMAEMWRRELFTGKYRACFWFPVHDEVVFSVHKDDALACIREAHECMTQPYATMTIPVVSSIAVGDTFGSMIECGDSFDEEAIRAALDKIFNKEEVAA